MTAMQMHLDIIDFRKGRITIAELRERFPSWRVHPDYAKLYVSVAQGAPIGRANATSTQSR